METHVFAAVLFAALLHAGWNALVKIGLDRVSTILLLSLVQGALVLPLVPFSPLPAPDAWIWIGAGALLHVAYKIPSFRPTPTRTLARHIPWHAAPPR